MYVMTSKMHPPDKKLNYSFVLQIPLPTPKTKLMCGHVFFLFAASCSTLFRGWGGAAKVWEKKL